MAAPIRLILLLLAVWSIANERIAAGESNGGASLLAFEEFDYPRGAWQLAGNGVGWKNPWQISRTGLPSIADFPSTAEGDKPARSLLIQGTAKRNNPLRRELAEPFAGRELFVRFDLLFAGGDREASAADPEFFVLWLDRSDGGDGATHAESTPNIGVHFADRGPQKDKNVFMVRVGPAHTAWSKIELEYNRPYRVISRLMKSGEGSRAEYDRLDLWVDPQRADLGSPDATVTGVASVSRVQWIGFATGLKTEVSDRVHVRHLLLADTWEKALDESTLSAPTPEHRGHRGIVWNKPVDFRRDVYPLLKARCFDCHAGENPESGYRLDVHQELLGYSTGEVLVEPGRSEHSRLIQVVAAESAKERMPPDDAEPLTDEQIALLMAWIDQGLKWDDDLLPPPRRASDHWSFQSIKPVAIPLVPQPEWLSTPVDAFIAQRHAEAGLRPSPRASPEVLVRRLYLDLLGLPPTPEQAAEFLRDSSPRAYERLVEQLLDSPHYGERWGRYWLDLARWAESQGYQHDFVRPYAWRYRDYVINSFNRDKPYDRFLKEQLAGDELQPYSDENLIATGFLGAARISGNEENEEIQRNDVLVDIVNATSGVILGLTLECAQCHNHKFDPISQRDYYRLQAFFVKGQLGNLSLRDPDAPNPLNLHEWIPEAALEPYRKEVTSLIKKRLFEPTDRPHTWGYLSAATGDPGIERLPVVNRKPIVWRPAELKHAQARLLARGDVANPGPVVLPGWPEVLGATPSGLGDRSRSALADWLAEPGHPLVARVWANRIWQYHFGRGIVPTSSDFGVAGEPPSHPALLDWLALELIRSGWNTKHLHRQIVLSSTYRQQSQHNETNAAIDPDNVQLWRWPRRRLEAEAIRDSVLVVTGELDRTIGGVSVPADREEEHLRRTIYLFQQRSDMPSVMAMFDAPTGVASCSRRAVSTVALQPLYMLNSAFMARRARALAERIREAAGDDSRRQVQLAFQRTLTRGPDSSEEALAQEILKSAGESAEAAEAGESAAEAGESVEVAGESAEAHDRLVQLCHALLNLNEFVYIP